MCWQMSAAAGRRAGTGRRSDKKSGARQKASGNQLGDPAKAGEAVVHITSVDRPPAHLVLGSDTLRLVTAARTAVDKDIRTWEALSRTTDFAEGAQL
ncbi:hypothetical protein GCM10010176_065050 [Nonomuraea spiralis]|nr:hypothetical protein GCM10010176_065050 [Nonomuraea spiralis]